MTQKTYSPKASEITRVWRLVDADGQTLGRLATQVAGFLRGKHRPTFAEHLDMGDYVVIVNASRIRVTGNKARDRLYYRHSNYPGGFKSVPLGEVLEKHPDRLLKRTVRGMLPHNALGRKMLRKLKVYAGPAHPHEAQFRASEKLQRAEEQTA
jgi:large subunit ribosomal protein L13